MELPEGRFAAVMGPSGSGKSALMYILAGLDVPTSGRVWVGGEDIMEMSDAELTLLRRRRIAFTFQFFNLLPMLTAEDNVVLPRTLGGGAPEREWIDGVMAKVALAERRRHRPSGLSGGQQQRVAIARALISRPAILFANEPTGNLDPSTSNEILTVLRESVDGFQQTTLMVTHDASAAAGAGASGRSCRPATAPRATSTAPTWRSAGTGT